MPKSHLNLYAQYVGNYVIRNIKDKYDEHVKKIIPVEKPQQNEVKEVVKEEIKENIIKEGKETEISPLLQKTIAEFKNKYETLKKKKVKIYLETEYRKRVLAAVLLMVFSLLILILHKILPNVEQSAFDLDI